MKIITLIVSDPLVILDCIRWSKYLVPFIALAVIFILLIIIPQQWRQQQQLAVNKQIKPGTHIVTIHGLKGMVCHASENFIIIELDDGRKVEILRQAVASIHHE